MPRNAMQKNIFHRPLGGRRRKTGELKQSFPILVAEDDPVSRKILEKTLTKAEYEVVSVENGKKALDTLGKRFFPIILTDWMMPEMDGLQLCRLSRQLRWPGYIYIILLTAKDSKDDIIAGLEAGADDYLTKPFNHAELIARLNTGRRILELERSLKDANEEIRILSITDPLTGCYNRGYLAGHLPQEIKRARRYNRPLSVVLSDLDHFKSVNDTYGHSAGDLVLKKFVQCIRETIRNDVDWVARFGGEEFLIVFPETDIQCARRPAERIRTRLSQRAFAVEGEEILITASFGITGFGPDTPDQEITPEAMIRKADSCLYRAKRQGRNRIRLGGL
ncbi:MAG: diguanylate cyclase [Desulfatiglandaceae bacterium]